MKIGKDLPLYLEGLTSGKGLVSAAAGIRRRQKAHKRAKELKSTPETRNYNVNRSGASNGATNVNIWHSETTESGSANDWS